MNKLSGLIDTLEELASSAPEGHRSQLSRQVTTLRAAFKKQQERYIDFLQLSEEYADKYLLNISAEIRQQSSFLDMLEKHLDMAKTLRQQSVDPRRSYESGTVATMKDVRTIGKIPFCCLSRRNPKTCLLALSQALPEDFDLFGEVELVLCQIRQCYVEMDTFWTEEICRAAKALERCRIDPNDVERWKNFHASLKGTVGSWKVTPLVLPLYISNLSKYVLQNGSPNGSSQNIRRNSPRPSTVGSLFLLL
jgi:hypothetical protein